MKIGCVEELIDYVDKGNRAKYIFFWGHRKPKSGIGKTCFSQWYEAAFEKEGVKYLTAEHFMMAQKALLFNDQGAFEKIIKARTPGEAKKLGRAVKDFDDTVWVKKRFEIVVEANCLKFSQNKDLLDFLLNTGDRVIVEASPLDTIWGIGLAQDHQDIENPHLWKGLNLLGFALMEVRERLG